jgi:hypothetical protein
MPMPGAPADARRILAALANETARRVYAEFEVDGVSPALEALSPSRRRHVTELLTGAGLLRTDGDALVLDAAVFADALAATTAAAGRPERRTGIDRFLTAEGRIAVYPAKAAERAALLAAIGARVLDADEVVGEREITVRLSAFTDDPAVLRRYLVDAGELERTRSGSEYARPRR